MATDQRIDLAEALRRVVDSRLSDVNTALPGEVVRYDAGAEVVDVRPMIRRAVPDEDGETVLEDLPVIPSVPVSWPAAGGCAITFPISVGDHVQILFNQRDLDHYRASGGDLSDPGVLSTHGLSGAVALPVAIRGAVGADATHLKIVLSGSTEVHVGGDSDAAALSSLVDALVDAICTSAVGTSDGGALFQTNIKAALALAGINTAGAADMSSAILKTSG